MKKKSCKIPILEAICELHSVVCDDGDDNVPVTPHTLSALQSESLCPNRAR